MGFCCVFVYKKTIVFVFANRNREKRKIFSLSRREFIPILLTRF